MTALITLAELIGIPSILSGVVILWLSSRMNRMDCRGEARRQENMLILKGLLTIGGLSSATAKALKEGAVNGHVTEALEDYSQYREQLSAFLVEQTVKKTY